MAKTPHALVSCELIIRRGEEILLGKRINCAGAGTWGLPGGHVEPRERLVSAACREAKEELGAVITVEQLRIISIVDTPQPDRHYVRVSFELREPDFEPHLAEPERCAEWRYFPLAKLPTDIFWAHQAIL